MTSEQRQAARERCGKATPSPWQFWAGAVMKGNTVLLRIEPRDHTEPICQDCENAYFAVSARADLPAALDALDAADARIADLERLLFALGCQSAGVDNALEVIEAKNAALEKLEALEARIAELEADKARLDWLESRRLAFNRHYRTEYGWKFVTSPNVNRLFVKSPNDGIDLNDADGNGPDIRTAIDGAMKP